MVDIGFWELIIIAIVGLLVIGPDKLPEVARTLGRWTGRARAFVNSVKSDIDRDLRAQELKEMLRPKERDDLYEFLEETKQNLNVSPDNNAGNDPQKPSSAPSGVWKGPS